MKLLAAALACIAAVSSAAAADLPYRTAPGGFAPAVPPPFTWTGFYIGGNAGAVFNGGNTSNIFGNGPVLANAIADGTRPSFESDRNTGFSGGGQIGYNVQFGTVGFGGAPGGFVVGVEADAVYTGVDNTQIFESDRASILTTRTDFIGTVRGRLGYGTGNFLPYITGGFAYGEVSNNTNFYGPASALLYRGAESSLRTGYTYGGGLEIAIPVTSFVNVFHASAVTIKGEILRYQLGTNDLLIASTTNVKPGYTQSIRTDGNLVRLGINYKFGAPVPTPVVARY